MYGNNGIVVRPSQLNMRDKRNEQSIVSDKENYNSENEIVAVRCSGVGCDGRKFAKLK